MKDLRSTRATVRRARPRGQSLSGRVRGHGAGDVSSLQGAAAPKRSGQFRPLRHLTFRLPTRLPTEFFAIAPRRGTLPKACAKRLRRTWLATLAPVDAGGPTRHASGVNSVVRPTINLTCRGGSGSMNCGKAYMPPRSGAAPGPAAAAVPVTWQVLLGGGDEPHRLVVLLRVGEEAVVAAVEVHCLDRFPFPP